MDTTIKTTPYKELYVQEQRNHLQTQQNYEGSKSEVRHYKTLYEQEREKHQVTSRNYNESKSVTTSYKMLYEQERKKHQVTSRNYNESKSETTSYKTLYGLEREKHQVTSRNYNESKSETTSYKMLYEQERKKHQVTSRNYNESKSETTVYKTLYEQEREKHQVTSRNYNESKSETTSYKTLYEQEREKHQVTSRNYNESKSETTVYKTLYEQEREKHQVTSRNYNESKSETTSYKTLYEQEREKHQVTSRNYNESKSETTSYKTLYEQEREKHQVTSRNYNESKSETTSYKNLYEQERLDKNRLAIERAQIEETASRYANSWKTTHKEITTTTTELGRGGWGLITIGFFREQKVAVKQLYKIIMNESSLAIMHREINTMSRLRHPNLLLFIGAALDHPSGNPLIITEIMDTSLRHAYEKNQIKEKNVKLSILRDTAAGLNYLHCHPDEIIHRDVSSANVLLESRGPNKWRAKLSDFGSANIARNAFTQAAGAAVYSAPESVVTVAIRKRPQQSTKMDVFSYGVLLCEVMTCRFPEVDKFQDMLQSISASSPPIGNIIRLCIEDQPKDRPTMKQIINRIDSYMK